MVILCPELEVSTHTDTHTSCDVPPGVPVVEVQPYRGYDEETMTYSASVMIYESRADLGPRFSPVYVCVCVHTNTCVWVRACVSLSALNQGCLTQSHTHTSFLHACVFLCFSERKCVSLRRQTRCWACGGRGVAYCRLHLRLVVLSHNSSAERQQVGPCRPPQGAPAEGRTPVGQHDCHAD